MTVNQSLCFPIPIRIRKFNMILYIGMRTYPAKSPILTNWHTVNRRSHGASPLISWDLTRLPKLRRTIVCVLLYRILTN